MFSLGKKILSLKKPAAPVNTEYSQVVLELAHDWDMPAERVQRLIIGGVPQSANEAGVYAELQKRNLITG